MTTENTIKKQILSLTYPNDVFESPPPSLPSEDVTCSNPTHVCESGSAPPPGFKSSYIFGRDHFKSCTNSFINLRHICSSTSNNFRKDFHEKSLYRVSY